MAFPTAKRDHGGGMGWGQWHGGRVLRNIAGFRRREAIKHAGLLHCASIRRCLHMLADRPNGMFSKMVTADAPLLPKSPAHWPTTMGEAPEGRQSQVGQADHQANCNVQYEGSGPVLRAGIEHEVGRGTAEKWTAPPTFSFSWGRSRRLIIDFSTPLKNFLRRKLLANNTLRPQKYFLGAL
jgi:hypothetical protein